MTAVDSRRHGSKRLLRFSSCLPTGHSDIGDLEIYTDGDEAILALAVDKLLTTG